MGTSRAQYWRVGDLFLVPLQDGSSVVGQIAGQEQSVLNSATCAFFDCRVRSSVEIAGIGILPPHKVFSVLFVTRDMLDSQQWVIVGHRRVELPTALLPHENLRSSGYIGAKVTGSANVTKFLNAFHALAPWDMMKDPNYFDRFLTSPDRKPRDLIYKQQP